MGCRRKVYISEDRFEPLQGGRFWLRIKDILLARPRTSRSRFVSPHKNWAGIGVQKHAVQCLCRAAIGGEFFGTDFAVTRDLACWLLISSVDRRVLPDADDGASALLGMWRGPNNRYAVQFVCLG